MKKIFATLVFIALTPTISCAAEMHLVKSPSVVHEGDTFTVGVSVDTGVDIVNALEGSIHIPSVLKLLAIRLSGSVVPLWIEQPQEKTPGIIRFAGVLPGGFQYSSTNASPEGNAFTLVFEAREAGLARLVFGSDTAVYKNDGEGTRAPLSMSALTFSVLPRSGAAQKIFLPEDTTAPESFVPLIVSGELYGYPGSVLMFNAHDKDSGILRYDIARSYTSYSKEANLSWTESVSPYPLSEEDTDKYMFVRAVDYAGNTYVAHVSPQRFSINTLLHAWWLIALCLLVLGIVLFRALRGQGLLRRS